MKVYVELVKNFRFKGGPESLLAQFCESARVGQPRSDLIAQLNENNLVTSMDSALRFAHTNALWIAPTNKTVQAQNAAAIERLDDGSNMAFRSISRHVAADQRLAHDGSALMTADVAKQLHAHTAKSKSNNYSEDFGDLPPNDITFIVGQSVLVPSNLGTQVMLFYGALGTVKSFSFRKLPKKKISLRPEYAAYKEDLIKREFPIIFVQMDQLAIDPTTGLQFSCDPDVPRLEACELDDLSQGSGIHSKVWSNYCLTRMGTLVSRIYCNL